MSEPLLQLSKLHITYGKTVAVPDLDLAVAPGELVALLGPSGCGKTTTMRAAAGLLPVESGTVRLEGRDITRLPPNKRDIGLVFQSYALFPHLTAFENVAFGLRLRKVPADELQRRTLGALKGVGLAGFEQRRPAELSGGQQQRVALARAIVVRPKLLLLDEPLSNLDARLRLEMRAEIKRLQTELALGMVYVTHDQAEALALADRVAVMKDGRIEQWGAPEEIYERPRSEFVARFVGFETILEGRAWRPAAVVVGSGPYRGTVAAVSYLGHAVELLIQGPMGPVKAEMPPGGARPEMGAEVAFDLPADRAAKLTS